MKKYTITTEDAGTRLDKFLVEQTGEPRNQLQHQIKKGLAKINDKVSKANYKLKEDEILTLEKEEIVEKDIEEEIKELPEVEIIEENDEFIIINKPAGLIVHGGDQIKEATLVDVLLKKWPDISKVGEDPDRPGIVHRLDKEVSGLMVIPRSYESFENLKEQFKTRDITKNYTALVHGQTSKDYDEIDFRIKRSNQGFKMAAIPKTDKGRRSKEGRYAATHFDVTKRFLNFTLLSIKIITGRTHQIRVHLSAYGHPIVGDSLYARREHKDKNDKLGLGRIFLFANNLEFKNIAGETVNFQVEMPKILKELLKKVK